MSICAPSSDEVVVVVQLELQAYVVAYTRLMPLTFAGVLRQVRTLNDCVAIEVDPVTEFAVHALAPPGVIVTVRLVIRLVLDSWCPTRSVAAVIVALDGIAAAGFVAKAERVRRRVEPLVVPVNDVVVRALSIAAPFAGFVHVPDVCVTVAAVHVFGPTVTVVPVLLRP